MKSILTKYEVCAECTSVAVTDVECICVYAKNYPTIVLEFKECACCGHILDDGFPSDTPFNIEQWKKFEEDGKSTEKS